MPATHSSATPRRLALALLCALATGCATGRGLGPPTPETMTFDNGVPESVAVYLVLDGHDWLLGHVDAGTSRALRLPGAGRLSTGGSATIVAVPLGSRDSFGRRGSDAPGAIRGFPLVPHDVGLFRWRLDTAVLMPIMMPPTVAALRRTP